MSKSSKGKQTRIAVVNPDKCKPQRCRQECKKSCPVVAMGKLCIEVTSKDQITKISEVLCNGCGICVKKCPFDAIMIVNVPSNLDRETVHRYSENSFKLHRIPVPHPNEVLGLVGANGIGKSTAMKILAGDLRPNFGNFKIAPEWPQILANFHGSALQNYFTKMRDNELIPVVKPQYVDQIPKQIKGRVNEILDEEMIDAFDLKALVDRDITKLSGGELQRLACAIVCGKKDFANVFLFDEPSSFLDVKQRLNVAKRIRSLMAHDKYVIVVEHDLAVLDYLSDTICMFYGVPGAYGVVTKPSTVSKGINIFLDGFIPSENMRFREEALIFKVTDATEEDSAPPGRMLRHHYPKMTKTLGDFKLEIDSGSFTNSEIVVLLGENGTGKTTFIKLLAGKISPDSTTAKIPNLIVSYKPQKLNPKFPGTVRQLFQQKIRETHIHPQFVSDVMKPLKMDLIIDNEVGTLSGGELQRVALVLCLGQSADLYLIDEPSAYLDSEQRLITSKVIKRFILHEKKMAFVVEHDFIMSTYLADKVIVFEGQPSQNALANSPQSLLAGMNTFLKLLGITFRRDVNNQFRPRINKLDSVKDVEQKRSGNYFFLED